jgi:hypothetical protein
VTGQSLLNVLIIRVSNPMFVYDAINSVALSSLSCFLVKEFSVLVSVLEP